MPAGFTICKTCPGNGGGSPQEFFQVAIDDEKLALDTVRNFTNAASDAVIEIAGELSASHIRRLGLLRGEVLRAGKTSPGQPTAKKRPG
jgi:hypothetical protein